MKNTNIISNILSYAFISLAFPLATASLSAQGVSTVDYYLRGNSGYTPLTQENSLQYWSLTRDEYTAPESLPGADAMVIIDRVNTNGSSTLTFARGDFHKPTTYYAIRATVNTELNMTAQLSLVGDFTINARSTNPYSTDPNIKQLRLVSQTADFLTVGGDMILSTDKYFTTRFSLYRSASMKVGGSLQFDWNGSLSDTGYHAFDMSDVNENSTGTLFTINLGGLVSNNRAVYMTSAHSLTSNFVFSNDSSGAFKGGSFEGVFATRDSVSSTANFSMNGSGRQSITIYKAANAAAHGIAGIGGRNDMTIGEVSVSSGELIFNSELAVNSVLLDGGSLKLTASEGVGDFTVNAGSLVYGGPLKVGNLTVAAVDEVKVVFSAEDLASQYLVIMDYGYLTDAFDPDAIFVAYDESGNRLGGTFALEEFSGGSGSLVYTVPEPAAYAAIFAMAAVAAAFARRKRK